MTDAEWFESVKNGDDAGWKLIWEKVVVPESSGLKSVEIMNKYSLTQGDLMGMLYNVMIGERKIDLFRNDGGSFQGWLRRYVRGFILNANPNKHGEVSLNALGDDESEYTVELPVNDYGVQRKEIWNMTHLCFKDLWNDDPAKAYVMLLKTRFYLSSDEIKDMLDISSAGNVDQIFSRAVKFMRQAWPRRDKNK